MSFRGVIQRGHDFMNNYPRSKLWWQIASKLTLTAVGLWAKSYVQLWHRAKIENREILLKALEQSKREGRGLVTIMNHVSVLDDPLVWGTVPAKMLWTKGHMRWTLGADNICFKNKPASIFFSLGQVLSTKRFGTGPFQPSLDASVGLLSRESDRAYHNELDQDPLLPGEPSPEWVHIYPEGFVHQPFSPHEHTMKYFKWGVSRLVLEPTRPPIVVPIFGHGLEQVFPEDLPKRALGYGFQRPILYQVGPPVDEHKIKEYRDQWQDLCKGEDMDGYVPERLQTGEAAQQLRSDVAGYLRTQVAEIRRNFGFKEEAPGLATAAFWKAQELVKLKGMTLKEKAKTAHIKLDGSRDSAKGPSSLEDSTTPTEEPKAEDSKDSAKEKTRNQAD